MADRVVERTEQTTEPQKETVIVHDNDRPAREGLSTGAIIAIIVVIVLLLLLIFGRGLFGGGGGSTTPSVNVQGSSGQ